MEYYPPSLVRLIRHLAKLPGIGEKTATRLALHILRTSDKEANALSTSILEVKENVRLCSKCYGLADTDPCSLCSDPSRVAKTLCIVEQPSDLVALEKSGAYRGLYHVLHGALSPINGVGPEALRIKELVARVRGDDIEELVLATNTNVEGESTASYICELFKNDAIRITRIASGVPMGSDLKYVDEVTLKRALERRQDL